MPHDTNLVLHLKDTVTIMRPLPSVLPRGANSYRERQPTRSIRMPVEVLEAVDDAAEMLGMSRSAYMNWCSYQVALDLIKQRREYKAKR